MSYHLAEYWNERYTKDTEPFEWYQKWKDLKPLLGNLVCKESRVLVLGCGSSNLSFDLYDEGVKSIDSIDISQVVVNQLNDRKGDRNMNFYVRDSTDMGETPDATYDIIIDKATIDSLLCGEGARQKVNDTLSHCSRILKAGGSLISISYAQPDMRLLFFDQEGYKWTVESKSIEKPKLLESSASVPDHHYIYIMKRS
ncbi:hypothetical protein KIPB_002694 [Kipferlia bialata]|uniref:Methyltransferase domain-containing protein n=1 Tax=Kipferlia bialata TaxID=797122 RepID=A0A9K3CU84_9EUKA|nr:hypothetical protein KIPB_002694 [Kipferlia bialata]|eukprot:g2694.t1